MRKITWGWAIGTSLLRMLRAFAIAIAIIVAAIFSVLLLMSSPHIICVESGGAWIDSRCTCAEDRTPIDNRCPYHPRPDIRD